MNAFITIGKGPYFFKRKPPFLISLCLESRRHRDCTIFYYSHGNFSVTSMNRKNPNFISRDTYQAVVEGEVEEMDVDSIRLKY